VIWHWLTATECLVVWLTWHVCWRWLLEHAESRCRPLQYDHDTTCVACLSALLHCPTINQLAVYTTVSCSSPLFYDNTAINVLVLSHIGRLQTILFFDTKLTKWRKTNIVMKIDFGRNLTKFSSCLFQNFLPLNCKKSLFLLFCRESKVYMDLYSTSMQMPSNVLRYGSHSVTCKQHHICLYSQSQSIAALWPVLIVPTHGGMARLSWAGWLVRLWVKPSEHQCKLSPQLQRMLNS